VALNRSPPRNKIAKGNSGFGKTVCAVYGKVGFRIQRHPGLISLFGLNSIIKLCHWPRVRAWATTRWLVRWAPAGWAKSIAPTDTKLDREVAIKVLPAAFAQHPERLARFEREAKVLASLDHRNIVSIYAVEEAFGQLSGQPMDGLSPPIGRVGVKCMCESFHPAKENRSSGINESSDRRITFASRSI
jgi:serine/threonine protein kinase